MAWPTSGHAAPAAGTSRAQADYATDSFGDPWDFSNPEDFILTPSVQSEGVHNLAMAGGQLTGSAEAGGKFEFLRSWQGMGLPWGRDPEIYPLDAGHYTTISFSMTADHGSAGGGGVGMRRSAGGVPAEGGGVAIRRMCGSGCASNTSRHRPHSTWNPACCEPIPSCSVASGP